MITHFKKEGLQEDPLVSEILRNQQELIADPNIIFDKNGIIYNIDGNADDSKFKKIKNAHLFVANDDEYCKNFGESLTIAKNKRSKFPLVYVKWLQNKDRFDGQEFNGISVIQDMFSYKDFRRVIFLSYFRSTMSSAVVWRTRPPINISASPSSGSFSSSSPLSGLASVFTFGGLCPILSSVSIPNPSLTLLEDSLLPPIAIGGVIGAYLLICFFVICYKIILRKNFFETRQEKLQKYIDSNMTGLLARHNCLLKVGPFGGYLKFAFTVSRAFYRRCRVNLVARA